MHWRLLNRVLLGFIFFTLLHVEQFHAYKRRMKKKKNTRSFRYKQLIPRSDCTTPSEFTILNTQDEYMLVYDPHRSQCAELEVYSWVGHFYQQRECMLGPGIHWFYFHYFKPGEVNIFKIFDSKTQEVILPETERFFLPKKPPPAADAWTKLGFGQVWTYVMPPKESAPNLLGYRISLLDLEKYKDWRVVGMFENVKYECSYPKLAPVHNCPQWPSDGVYCTLFTDLVWWPDDYAPTSNASMKFVKIETFRIPTDGCERRYSDPIILPLFSLANATTVEPVVVVTSKPRPYTDWLWSIFLGAAIVLLAIGIPLVYLCAVCAGVGAAQRLWQSIAGAEGNVTIALGENQVIWETCPPWRCDSPASGVCPA